MNFDEVVKAVMTAGAVFGPIFIHSDRGVAILNASEQTAALIVAQHKEAHSVKKETSKKK